MSGSQSEEEGRGAKRGPGRPRIGKERMVANPVTAPADLWARIEEAAAATGESRSAWLRRAAEELLAQELGESPGEQR